MSPSLEKSLQSLLGPAFEIRRELRGGGMSRVFVAYEPALKREVAIKVLPPDLLSTTSVARFRQEIEVTAQLQHPHILPVVTTGGTDSLIYYVMPYIAGGSLRERLVSGERPGFAQGVRMTEELLAAIAVAHERGIVHRDIKPGNVLISEGHAMLADFGIARAREALELPHEGEAQTTSVASPEAYRAPERPRDAAADLYAIAVLCFEMLTGILPLNVSESAIAGALLDGDRGASPVRVRAVAAVLARALSREPAARYSSARAFAAALSATAETRHRAGPFNRGAVAATLLIVAGATGWLAMRPLSGGDEDAPASGEVGPVVTSQGDPGVASLEDSTPTGDAVAHVPGLDSVEPAVSAYDEAMQALGRNQDATARELFTQVEADAPDYARAQLRLALLEAWLVSSRGREQATRAASKALDLRHAAGALDPREIAIAEGLVALGHQRFPDACASFERARAMRGDFDVWMGLGDCRWRDTVVVMRNGSPSFRSSYFEAARAYLEAGRRGVSGQASTAFMRLADVAFTERARVRRGWIDNERVVLGRPFAVADSFAFDAFYPGQSSRMAPDQTLAHNRALAMAGEMLRPALLAHTRSDTTDLRARLMLIELFEVEGNVDASRGDGVTALGEIEAARRLPADSSMAMRLADIHLRLLLRAGRFETAGRLGDSLLARANSEVPEAMAGQLFAAAMLTGRAGLAARLFEQISGTPGRQVRMRDGGVLRLPAIMLKARAAFTVSAALGVCNDEVREAPRMLFEMLDAYFRGDVGGGGAMPQGAESAFLERPLLQAVPCIGAERASILREPSHPLGRALLATTQAERALWTSRLEPLRRGRNSSGQLFLESPENATIDAYVYLAAGDSTGARATLSRMIQAIPVLPPPMLNSEFGAGLLVRGMALRAELAAAEGDAATARELAGAVASLWENADPALQPLVARMRALSGRLRP